MTSGPVAITPRARRDPLRLGHVVVIGGGCYGSWYTGQLARAIERGALELQRVTVVDRDPACRVALERARYAALPLEVATAAWHEWLGAWLGGRNAGDATADALVPSPLMPHLLLDWLLSRARDRWPGRRVDVEPLGAPPPTPWQRAAPDGRHYVSFADWLCPVNCIEPARCPVTRGPRDWSLPEALRAWVAAGGDAAADAGPGEGADGSGMHPDRPLRGPIIFHCVHRTWGVGMIDVAAIVAADATIASAAADGPARMLVGTVSHCHGALGVLHVD
jgi:hypothetical protein